MSGVNKNGTTSGVNFGTLVIVTETVRERAEPTPKAASPQGPRFSNKCGNKTVGAYAEANAWLERGLYAGRPTERPNGAAKKVPNAAGLIGKPNPNAITFTNDYAGFRKWLRANGYVSDTFASTEWYRLRQYRVNELSAAWLAAATKLFYDLTKYTPTGKAVRL